MNLNLRQLRSLVAIAHLGNFTRAAQSLHISQPALTVQMHHLEEALGVRLIDRNTRTVKLTPLGKQVVPIIERALGDIDAAIAGTRLTAESIGVVTVASLPSLCSEIMPTAIARFGRQYPGVTVRLREEGAHRIPACVIEEEADLGFGLLERPMPQLEATPFLADRLVVVCPAGHPLAGKRTVIASDLVKFPMIVFDAQNSVRTLLDAALQSLGASRAPDYVVSYVSTAVGMVRAGLGITVVSSSALGRAVMTGLRARPIKHPGSAREIVAMRKKGRTLSPAAEALLQVVCSVSAALQMKDQATVRRSGRSAPRRGRRASARA
jgi:LysR family transcriptional regulator, carnitine catabolism transcriptional activator